MPTPAQSLTGRVSTTRHAAAAASRSGERSLDERLEADRPSRTLVPRSGGIFVVDPRRPDYGVMRRTWLKPVLSGSASALWTA